MIKNIRKLGIITKGIIYSLVGILTLLAALNVGGEVSGKNQVVQFLGNQIFGKILLIIIAIGLIFYSIWRLYSAFFDGKNEGSDKSGIFKRIGYFFSGTIYGTLAYSISAKIINLESSGSSKNTAVEALINNEGGLYLLYVISIVLFCVGCYQFYKGYSGKFLNDIKKTNHSNYPKILEKTGKYGHISRGISFAIFGFFVSVAAYEKDASAIKGIQEMFSFLREFSWGNMLMGFMATGFICYGVYQYFLARYSKVE
ncbi:DUF1206 domain-containing protein [Polaribacter haliotis]|uniref:DUF1206 domain-containing protein n=1 Tax=Polaribacter haliotis TaxID=1888915 RepID=A0A7L8AIS0_9FLAO|nr:DUF1206 domain-containing protein [Polaribacter haliotis]QOD61892.1 DUF1206 domain-containing protein [Polaribacter haliotis]